MTRSITRAILVSVCTFFIACPVSAQNPPFAINSYTTDAQSFPSVCGDTSGNFVVVWESGTTDPTDQTGQDGSFLGIFGRRFVRGGAARGSEFAVNSYTTDYQTFPSVGCDHAGRFVVTWSSFGQDGSSSGVFGQRFDNNGAPAGSEFQINSFTTGTQDYPTLGVAADGDFIVVWTSEIQDGLGFGVFGQRYSSSGNKTGIEFRANSYTTGDQSYPAIAVGDAGSFIVTWSSNGQDGDGSGVYAQRFSSAALEVGSEFRVNNVTAGAQAYPAIANDATGGFMVVWSSQGQDGDDGGVFARRYGSDGTALGTEMLVNTYTTGEQIFPRIGTTGSGEFVIVWTSYGQDGSDAGVFGQRFTSNGQRAGTEFQVNPGGAGAQYSPAVAGMSGDDFVVVWAALDGEESGTDITGRWYAAATPTPTRTNTRPPTATRTNTATVPVPPSATATAPSVETAIATATPIATAVDTATETPTETPTDTPTAEPTATATAIDTPTVALPTATATPGVPGDCDNNGTVSVNELVSGVNVALGRLDLARCEAIDRNRDGHVNVDELVAAVRAALAV